MKKCICFLFLLFIFIGTVDAASNCFSVPRCNGGKVVYTTQCYNPPTNATIRMVVNTPVFSKTTSMGVPVDYDSRYVSADVRWYIPDIDGYIFTGYYYNGSKIVNTASIKVPYGSSHSVTGNTCYLNSSGEIIYNTVTVGRMYTSFGVVTLNSEWKPATYEVRLIDSKGVYSNNMQVSAENTTKKLPTSVKESNGFSFEGWYYDSAFTNKVETDTIVELNFKGIYDRSYGTVSGLKSGYEPLMLYAKWTKICDPKPKMKLIYETNGGNKIASESVDVSIKTSVKISTPVRSGYSFEGWYYDKDLKNKVTAKYKDELKYVMGTDSYSCKFINDMTLYAKWQKIDTQNPTLDSEEEKLENDNEDKNIQKEENDKKEDNKKENNKKDEDTNKEEIIECPIEDKFYTVKYNSNGGTTFDDFKYCSTCEMNNLELPKPEREGYVFAGWYYDINLIKKVEINDVTKIIYTQEYDENGCIKLTDVNLYAKWITVIGFQNKNSKVYTIRYSTNGGNRMYNDSVCFNCGTQTNLVEPKKEGFKFAGWYYDEKYNLKVDVEYLEDLEIGSVLSESTTINLYAKWEINKPEKDKNFIIYVLIGIIFVLLLLVFIVSYIKKKKKQKNDYEGIEVLGL